MEKGSVVLNAGAIRLMKFKSKIQNQTSYELHFDLLYALNCRGVESLLEKLLYITKIKKSQKT